MGLKKVEKSIRKKAQDMIQSGCGSTEIINSLGVSRGFVCALARKLGIVMPRPGCRRPTPLSTVVCGQCGVRFKRPTREIRRRGRKDVGQFCSQKCFRAWQGWSAQQIATLRRKYKTHSNSELAAELGKSEYSVAQRLHTLGLRRKKIGVGEVKRLILRLRKEAENVKRR